MVDTFISCAFRFIHTAKLLECAVAFLHDDVLRFYRERRLIVQAVLKDINTEFFGQDSHPYGLYFALNETDHRRRTVRFPETNGCVERFNRTVVNDFFRMTFQKTCCGSVDAPKRDLDRWLDTATRNDPVPGIESAAADRSRPLNSPKKGVKNPLSDHFTTLPLNLPPLDPLTLAMDPDDLQKAKEHLENTIKHLRTKEKVLLITTSNRWEGQEGTPKSTRLAYKIAGELRRSGVQATLFEVPKLTIYPCEGNVSDSSGNNCGLKKAILKDKNKNPSGYHRCWASINNADDELWKITKELFTSDCVVFFASVRWGALNSYYQKLIERLTWIENMHSTLGEENIVAGIEAGLIVIGHNWNGEKAFETQRRVLQYFGFQVNPNLCWNWQYTQNAEDETNESYIKAEKEFGRLFLEEGSSPASHSSPGNG